MMIKNIWFLVDKPSEFGDELVFLLAPSSGQHL